MVLTLNPCEDPNKENVNNCCNPEMVVGIPESDTNHHCDSDSDHHGDKAPSRSVAADLDLIIPKKIGNPCKDSIERQNLHKELMFNQKIGRNVLNQKSELQKALEKKKEESLRRQRVEEEKNTRTALQIALDERARRLQEIELAEENAKKPTTDSEFLKVHAKVCSRIESPCGDAKLKT